MRLEAVKVVGDRNVPRGQLTWRTAPQQPPSWTMAIQLHLRATPAGAEGGRLRARGVRSALRARLRLPAGADTDRASWGVRLKQRWLAPSTYMWLALQSRVAPPLMCTFCCTRSTSSPLPATGE